MRKELKKAKITITALIFLLILLSILFVADIWMYVELIKRSQVEDFTISTARHVYEIVSFIAYLFMMACSLWEVKSLSREIKWMKKIVKQV